MTPNTFITAAQAKDISSDYISEIVLANLNKDIRKRAETGRHHIDNVILSEQDIKFVKSNGFRVYRHFSMNSVHETSMCSVSW